MRTTLVISLAAGVVLALAGCTPAAPADTTEPVASATAEATILDPNLVPRFLVSSTAEYGAAEASRLGDTIEAIIDPSVILNISDASQLVPADDDIASYYAVYRTYTLDPAVDSLTLAGVMVTALQQSGWTLHESGTEDEVYIAALSNSVDEQIWFVLLGGEASASGQSVLTMQIAGPDVTA